MAEARFSTGLSSRRKDQALIQRRRLFIPQLLSTPSGRTMKGTPRRDADQPAASVLNEKTV